MKESGGYVIGLSEKGLSSRWHCRTYLGARRDSLFRKYPGWLRTLNQHCGGRRRSQRRERSKRFGVFWLRPLYYPQNVRVILYWCTRCSVHHVCTYLCEGVVGGLLAVLSVLPRRRSHLSGIEVQPVVHLSLALFTPIHPPLSLSLDNWISGEWTRLKISLQQPLSWHAAT